MPWHCALKANGLLSSLLLLPFLGLETRVTGLWALRMNGDFGWEGFMWEVWGPMLEQNICTDSGFQDVVTNHMASYQLAGPLFLSAEWHSYSCLRAFPQWPEREPHLQVGRKIRMTLGKGLLFSLGWDPGVPSVAMKKDRKRTVQWTGRAQGMGSKHNSPCQPPAWPQANHPPSAFHLQTGTALASQGWCQGFWWDNRRKAHSRGWHGVQVQ